MTTKSVTLAHCEGCDRTLRLAHFRKWWGDKRLLRTLCDVCEPQKKLAEMSPEERANAVASGRANPDVVQRINETHSVRQAARTSSNRSQGRLRANNRLRRINWGRAIVHTLNVERAWAERNLQNPASDEWERFFEAYARALRAALERINVYLRSAARGMSRANLGGRNSTPLKPTMEDVDFRRWVFPETLQRLKNLYSACPIMRGRKPYREPALVRW